MRTSSPRGHVLILSFSLFALTLGISGCGSEVPGRVPGWGTAGPLATTMWQAYNPQIAMDATGNAVAVWVQPADATHAHVWASRFVAGAGWETATSIEANTSVDSLSPQVAMDATGNAVAVWVQREAASWYGIWANRSVHGAGWGNATRIQNDNTGPAGSPQVAVDRSGNAFVVWEQTDAAQRNIWANRYVAGVGWELPTLLEHDDTGSAGFPQVAVAPNGDGLAVWEQSDGTRRNVWANRYVAGVGWTTATLIETDDRGHAALPQVAVDADGNAVAVWQQHDGTRYRVWANRFVPRTGWETATLIDTATTEPSAAPQVAVDGGGNAIAVWVQFDGTRNNIWANRFVVGAGWGTPTLVETYQGGDALSPQIAMDAGGNAIAVWVQSDGTQRTIRANRFVPSAGWGTPIRIETNTAGGTLSPQVAMNPDGQAIAVWEEIAIWAARYVP